MSDLTAKQIASRFGGPEGVRYLHDLFQRQPITEGKIEIVEQFASFSVIESYEVGEVIIEQDGVDTDMLFILAGSVTVSPN